MSNTLCAKTRARITLCALALAVLASHNGQAQPATGAGPRVTQPARQSAKANDPFAAAMVPWFTLEPVGAGLIRTQGGARPLDLAAPRQDDNDIIVYGRHKAVDSAFGPRARFFGARLVRCRDTADHSGRSGEFVFFRRLSNDWRAAGDGDGSGGRVGRRTLLSHTGRRPSRYEEGVAHAAALRPSAVCNDVAAIAAWLFGSRII